MIFFFHEIIFIHHFLFLFFKTLFLLLQILNQFFLPIQLIFLIFIILLEILEGFKISFLFFWVNPCRFDNAKLLFIRLRFLSQLFYLIRLSLHNFWKLFIPDLSLTDLLDLVSQIFDNFIFVLAFSYCNFQWALWLWYLAL